MKGKQGINKTIKICIWWWQVLRGIAQGKTFSTDSGKTLGESDTWVNTGRRKGSRSRQFLEEHCSRQEEEQTQRLCWGRQTWVEEEERVKGAWVTKGWGERVWEAARGQFWGDFTVNKAGRQERDLSRSVWENHILYWEFYIQSKSEEAESRFQRKRNGSGMWSKVEVRGRERTQPGVPLLPPFLLNSSSGPAPSLPSLKWLCLPMHWGCA